MCVGCDVGNWLWNIVLNWEVCLQKVVLYWKLGIQNFDIGYEEVEGVVGVGIVCRFRGQIGWVVRIFLRIRQGVFGQVVYECGECGDVRCYGSRCYGIWYEFSISVGGRFKEDLEILYYYEVEGELD